MVDPLVLYLQRVCSHWKARKKYSNLAIHSSKSGGGRSQLLTHMLLCIRILVIVVQALRWIAIFLSTKTPLFAFVVAVSMAYVLVPSFGR